MEPKTEIRPSVEVRYRRGLMLVGDENEEVTVYGAKFYRAGTVKMQLTRATASGTEQAAYPECKQ